MNRNALPVALLALVLAFAGLACNGAERGPGTPAPGQQTQLEVDPSPGQFQPGPPAGP
jgi:hypothetical protein